MVEHSFHCGGGTGEKNIWKVSLACSCGLMLLSHSTVEVQIYIFVFCVKICEFMTSSILYIVLPVAIKHNNGPQLLSLN